MTLPRVRVDILPEKAQYRDTGCELAPACLSCPLPVCKHDYEISEPRALHRMVLHWRKRGIPVPEIARTLNTSTRTIHRILKRDDYPFTGIVIDPETRPANLPSLIHAPEPWPVMREDKEVVA